MRSASEGLRQTPSAACGRSSALVAARIDGDLLHHLLVACVCLVAHEEGETPRAVLERLFRRAVSDREWHEEFAPLLQLTRRGVARFESGEEGNRSM